MRRTFYLAALGIVALTLTGGERAARGQGVQNPNGPVGPIINPYINPMANPLLNPALNNGTANRNDALMYMWAAQQQPGALLGPSLRDTRGGGKAGNRPAEMPRSAMSPTGGASRYFQRGPSAQTATRAGRSGGHDRYFGKNGR